MHVMEDSDDAVAVSSDSKVHTLTTSLKPAAYTASSPKEQQSAVADKLQPEITAQAVPAAITSTERENETKDTETTTTAAAAATTTAGGDKEGAEAQAKGNRETGNHAAEPAVEKSSSSTISSTTPDNDGKKMPTATAVEVSEKIADSSDDAVSVLSSTAPTAKKPVTTAITPTVNSSASTETVEQKSSKLTEATSDGAVKEAASGKEGASESESKATNAEQKQDGSAAPTGPSGQLAEPTADDVMAGLDDDIMEQNGSEAGDEKRQREKEFNDDLTFQMDVDEEPAGETGGPKAGGKNENDSAMDLTAAGEPAKEKRTTMTTTDGSASSEPEVRLDERRASTTTSQTGASGKDSAVDMHDKTVVTSTPVTDPKKAQQKRLERGQEAAALEVKQEQEEEADEAQNLSKQRASAAGPPARAGERVNAPRNKAVEQQQEVGHPSGSRKRRRSVEPEEERRPGEAADRAAESEEPLEPAKKLKLEVDANYQTHERVVNEYIETTANTSVDEIQSHTDALVKEIQTLNDMIRDTEMKWNNLLHLKKVKEEILLRLNRRKHVIGIMDTRLGEVSVYSHLDSSNLSSHHQPGGGGRSSSVGPRPPTPPPEVEIRPASVANSMHYGFGGGNNGTTNGADKSNSSGHHHFGNSLISNRRSSSSSVQTGSKRASGKDSTSSFVSQFNSSNNAVTMVPLPQTATMILNARANMNPVEVAKEKSAAVQIQRQILPKPVLSNHQQILNNLAISAGLTGSSNSANSGGSATVSVQWCVRWQFAQRFVINTTNHLVVGVIAGTTERPSQSQWVELGQPSPAAAAAANRPPGYAQGCEQYYSGLSAEASGECAAPRTAVEERGRR